LSCNSCIAVSLPQCPGAIVINGGLDPNQQYRYEITDKFGRVYNGISTTDATGLFAINIVDNPDIPKGAFMSFSGTFILKAYKYLSAYEIQNAQFTVSDANYDCAELRFKDYSPSISYFDPDAPIYVPPASITPIEVHFTNQTSVVVTHGLGYKPFVQILDNTDELILPNSIIHNNNNQFTVTFSIATTGTISYR
jgi:hypothetical protein